MPGQKLTEAAETLANAGFTANDTRKALLCFHHINPDNKTDEIATIVRASSIEKTLEEIKKCIVLCQNCHAKEHWVD